MKLIDNRFLMTLALFIIAWALVYQNALVGMEEIWARSDTFAHGYFILPISLWLIWQDRANLLTSTVQPSWLALPLLAISLFVGLFAYAADINVLGQLSAVTSLIFILWMLIGNKFAWHYKFPLAYLLFLVPMGENLIPWLQDVTAWFTVVFLKLNGIPVYVDGLYIQIPTGMFEVAVACSGIRYLIASAAVGALYGYLTYNKFHKQLIFFIFALTLPILANGIRAYGIVAIAYYSDMKYATGADHLIYGWIFFGFIIMLMFWIGGFFADSSKESPNVAKGEAKHLFNRFSISLPISSALALPLLFTSLYLMQSIPNVEPSQATTSTEKALKTSTWGIHYSESLMQSFRVNDLGLEEFQAIYANKQTSGEMISWENINHNPDAWTVIGTKNISLGSKSSLFVHLRTVDGAPRSYLYHYKVGDFYVVNKNKAKLMQAWNSLSRQSDQSEIRAISIVGESDLAIAEGKLRDAFQKADFSNIYSNNLLKQGR